MAFSEYALACRRAGLELRHVWGGLARAKGSGPANEDGGLARLLASTDLKVIETEPGVKGDTATNVTKAAKIAGGELRTVQIATQLLEFSHS